MSHKAGPSFFDEKREWSKRKDRILKNYLTPYLSKLAMLRRPILIVDGFAGAGRFGDGEVGSPLIICETIRKLQESPKGLSVPVKVLAVESDEDVFQQLSDEINVFTFAEARNDKFDNVVPEILNLATTHTVFLYLDPYTVEGITWESMDRIFTLVGRNKSVEVLLNFNASAFCRQAFQAAGECAPAQSDEDIIEDGPQTPTSVGRLNEVVGGDWWQSTIRNNRSDFPRAVEEIANGYCGKLSGRFTEVCRHAVKAKSHHQVPKYYLIFGSRHEDALILMNDEMVKSREALVQAEESAQLMLIETRSEELVPDTRRLPGLILNATPKRSTRKEVVVRIIRAEFGNFSSKEIIRNIKELLKTHELLSGTGKPRINDKVIIWRPEV